MKQFYRKSYGCFICTDVYHRPWYWGFRHYLPNHPHLGAFALSFSVSLLFALLFDHN